MVVTTLKGEQLLVQNQAIGDTHTAKMDVSSLPSGTYILNVRAQGGVTKHSFVKY